MNTNSSTDGRYAKATLLTLTGVSIAMIIATLVVNPWESFSLPMAESGAWAGVVGFGMMAFIFGGLYAMFVILDKKE